MDNEPLDVRSRLEPFVRRWPVIAMVVLLVTAGTYLHYASRATTYSATAQLFAQSTGLSPVVGRDPETDPARRLLNEAQILQSPTVAAKVAADLGYRGDPRDLLSDVSVSPSSDSDFLSVTATATDGARAAALANGFAAAFASLSVSTLATGATSQPTVKQVYQASVPTSGSGPSPARNAVFAAVIGLVLAGLLVLGIEAFDRRLRGTVVEAEYQIPMMAEIPFHRGVLGLTGSGSRLPPEVMERVRSVRASLAQSGSPPRTTLITSAIPGEGKSTLVKSLALSCFESGKSVLVIDADLRRPRLHEFFEAPMVPGLADVLRSALPLWDAVQEVVPDDIEPVLNGDPEALAVAGARQNGGSRQALPARAEHRGRPVLHLLTSGSSTNDPAALLGSRYLVDLVAAAAERYDMVLIDSPPVLGVSDAMALAAAVDAVVVVARSDYVTRDAALKCRETLARVPGATVVGLVANAVRGNADFGRFYYASPHR